MPSAGTATNKKARSSSASGQPAGDVEDELLHPRAFLRAWILILTAQRPAHGYELLDRLQALGYKRGEAATIYRSLRWLETAGLASASWDTSGGPARRVFTVTAQGRHLADKCAAQIQQRHQLLGEAVAGRSGVASPAPAGSKRTFEALVEAKLLVQAGDEESARCAIAALLSAPGPITGGVRATGQVWVYDVNEVAGD